MRIRRWTSKNKDKHIKIRYCRIKRNGGENMEALVYNDNIKNALDMISSKIVLLDGKNGMIKLDKNNPSHKDWFEDDDE